MDIAAVPLVSARMTLPTGGNAHHGFPGLALTPSRRLIAAFRRGATHLSYDGDIMTMHSDDSGLTWSGPRCAVSARDGHDLRDPSLTLLSDGTLIMVFFSRTTTALRTCATRSADEGGAWDEPVVVADLACSAPAVELSGGELVQPLYRGSVARLHESLDGGRTWRPRSVVLDGAEIFSEPWAVGTGGSGLVALVRNDTDHRTKRLESLDGGRSWSAPSTAFVAGSRISWLKGSTGRSLGFYRAAGDPRHLMVRASETDFATWTDATVVHSAGGGGRNAYACPLEVAPGVHAVVISQEDGASRAGLHFLYVTEGPACTPLGATSVQA